MAWGMAKSVAVKGRIGESHRGLGGQAEKSEGWTTFE